MSEAVIVNITWRTAHDAKTCILCRMLDGVTWRRQNIYEATLRSPYTGKPVWDLNTDEPLTHPNCRCKLEVDVKIDLDQIEEYSKFKGLLRPFR